MGTVPEEQASISPQGQINTTSENRYREGQIKSSDEHRPPSPMHFQRCIDFTPRFSGCMSAPSVFSSLFNPQDLG